MTDIVSQLTEIYYLEDWHTQRMSHLDALQYHKEAFENGNICVYLQDEKVLGYYEREFIDNICFLKNIWIRPEYRGGEVFKQLKKHFFRTMPKNVTLVSGEKQKLKGKIVKERIYHGHD